MSTEILNPKKIDWILDRLVFLAICFSPFQLALTIKLGDSPLKISEILLGLAFLCFPFSSWLHRRVRAAVFIGIFVAIYLVSASVNYYILATEGIHMLDRGYTRSQQGDVIFYLVFALFSFFAWRVIASADRKLIERALVVAAWLLILAVLFQYIGVASGNQALVEALGFESEGRVENQTVSTRNGPFKEGQHLGFYAGFLLIVCVARKRWLACVGLLFCIYYSQSTTAILGIAAAALVLIIFRLNLFTFSLILVSSLSALLAFIFVGPVRDFFLFQMAKLGFDTLEKSGGETVSLDLRALKTEIGWRIMQDHPFIGVGPGRYSIWFFQEPLSDQAPGYYFNSNHRAIAENIYAQVAAELGLFALGALVLFLAVVLWMAIKRNEITVVAAVAFVGIGLSTQSTLTFLPVWVALAYVASNLQVTTVPTPDEHEIERQKI